LAEFASIFPEAPFFEQFLVTLSKLILDERLKAGGMETEGPLTFARITQWLGAFQTNPTALLSFLAMGIKIT
jgi:hypothetical protein